MKISVKILLFFFVFAFSSGLTGAIPVAYKGRIRPDEAFARLWLYDVYQRQAIKKKDLPLFLASSNSARDFIWNLNLQGHSKYNESPLFSISSAEIKNKLGLNPLTTHFSFQDFSTENLNKNQNTSEEFRHLFSMIQEFKSLNGMGSTEVHKQFQNNFSKLKEQGVSPKELANLLDKHYPLLDRLKASGSFLKVLPGKFKSGEWFSLHAVATQIYNPTLNDLVLIGNFTSYSDIDFERIQHTYIDLEKAFLAADHEKTQLLQSNLLHLLETAYKPLSGKPYQKAHGKALYFPTIAQLKIEAFYYRFPLIEIAIFLYGIAFITLCITGKLSSRHLRSGAFFLLGLAFIFHTGILVLRCYILGRPPVSNMFETVIYVPLIAVALSLFLRNFSKSPALLIASSFTSLVLLILLQITDLNNSLENVQPVLDSQFWLMIHVLMIVGSYGVFILGGVLGHFYLISYAYHKYETPAMESIGKAILQSLYLGTLLLISGTILGGVWAAESWGRFWDWDPKESWAFISSCIYLIVIHLYRFSRIRFFGLAMGSILGLLAISFTWYGVNYILGTGLHSYGFGQGGQYYYYGYVFGEIAFLLFIAKDKKFNTKAQRNPISTDKI